MEFPMGFAQVIISAIVSQGLEYFLFFYSKIEFYSGFCIFSFYGEECQYSYSCFGKNNLDQTVCQGHGTCTRQDVCSCESGYSPPDCSPPIKKASENSNEVELDSAKHSIFLDQNPNHSSSRAAVDKELFSVGRAKYLSFFQID